MFRGGGRRAQGLDHLAARRALLKRGWQIDLGEEHGRVGGDRSLVHTRGLDLALSVVEVAV